KPKRQLSLAATNAKPASSPNTQLFCRLVTPPLSAAVAAQCPKIELLFIAPAGVRDTPIACVPTTVLLSPVQLPPSPVDRPIIMFELPRTPAPECEPTPTF